MDQRGETHVPDKTITLNITSLIWTIAQRFVEESVCVRRNSLYSLLLFGHRHEARGFIQESEVINPNVC